MESKSKQNKTKARFQFSWILSSDRNVDINHMNQIHTTFKALYQQTLILTTSDANLRLEKLVLNYSPLMIKQFLKLL